MAQRMITALATLHGVDFEGCGLGDLGRPEGYLERQVRRFAGLWERGRTRDLPELDEVTEWLQAHLPESGAPSLVHGDFRIGNLLFCRTPPVRLLGIVDWEMATLGDPLADVGYLCAHLAERGDPGTVMTELQPVTREDGFPDSSALALRYAELTGRSVENLGWYRVLAVWKSAIFLEQSYARYLAGNDADPWFAEMADGVPGLVARARREAGLARTACIEEGVRGAAAGAISFLSTTDFRRGKRNTLQGARFVRRGARGERGERNRASHPTPTQPPLTFGR